jgi:hypothetical protein
MSRNPVERMNIVYDSEDCRLFAQALDVAWRIFLNAGALTTDNIDTAKAALTYAIFNAAESGERHPRRLAVAAVARMPKFEAVVAQQRMWRQPETQRTGSY